jgi:hypothetical protein
VVIKKNPHWDYSSFPYSLKHLTLNCVFWKLNFILYSNTEVI